MKKAFCLAFLLAFGMALSSRAVVIHWATDGVSDGTSSAALVYVSSGTAPTYAGDSLVNGEIVGSVVSGLAITPDGVGEQSTTDGTTRSGDGAYYVVLFKDGYYAYSLTSLAWDSTTAITADALSPATDVFTPGSFSGWTPVPEPSAALLLCIGAAAAVLRRKHRV